MHLNLISAGVHTPYTIILPAYYEQPELPPLDLSPLGGNFTIKPANGGGGEGVVIEASLWDHIVAARQEYPDDRYLLQAHIIPTQLGSHTAWFRIICCAGQAFVCWWDTRTHRYTPVSAGEEELYCLRPLVDVTATIANLSQLDLFSTEVALTAEGLFVVVDYVNDQIDLRLQSKAFDGVPDHIVHAVADRIARLVEAL